MLEQQSILHIIEKQRNYHSCIITTFSFDFYYFENNLLRRLQSAGIQNITILADEQLIGQALGQNTALIRHYGKRYSIEPIPCNGAFHPKIIMLFGERQGLLIVGSGNTTFSGHSKNFEIWGVFHYDIDQPEKNKAIWSSAWQYLKSITTSVNGVNKTKIDWISKYSSWLSRLPKSESLAFSPVNNKPKEQAIFLHSKMDVSLLATLATEIPNELVKTITVVAPFFDKNGQTLERIASIFPSASIRIILQSESGTLPENLQPNTRIKFYDWEQVSQLPTKNHDARPRKLHGKLIHFELSNDLEYLFLGSANISKAALGTITQKGINEEAGVLLRHSTKQQKYLNDLGLDFKNVKPKQLNQFKKSPWNIYEHNALAQGNSKRIHIKNIDRIGFSINMALDTSNLDDEDVAHIFTKTGILATVSSINIKSPKKAVIELDKIKEINEVLFIQIYSEKEQGFVSNKQIIQDVVQSMKSNPDPARKIYDDIISRLEGGEDDMLGQLLKHVIAEDFTVPKQAPSMSSGSKENVVYEEIETPISTEKQDYETFTKDAIANRYQGFSFENSNLARVGDFLHLAGKQFFSVEKENDDEENISDTGTDEGSSIVFSVPTYNKGKVSGISGFIQKYRKYIFSKYLDDNYKLTIKDLVALNISLYLLISFRGRIIKITNEKEERPIISVDKLSPLHLTNYCKDVVAMFLHMANRNGWAVSEDPIVQERLQKEKQRAFWHILFCLNNTAWHAKTLKDKDNIFYNAIQTLLEDDYMVFFENVETEMNNRLKIASYQYKDLEKGVIRFQSNTPSRFKRLNEAILLEDYTPYNKLKIGQNVYIKGLGIGFIRSISSNREGQLKAEIVAIGFRDKKSKNLISLNQKEILLKEAIKF